MALRCNIPMYFIQKIHLHSLYILSIIYCITEARTLNFPHFYVAQVQTKITTHDDAVDITYS